MKTLRVLAATGLALAALMATTLALNWQQPPPPVMAEEMPDGPTAPAAPLTLSPPYLSDDDVADAPYDNPPAPIVDGLIAPGEYAGAGKATFPGYGGDVEVFFKQDAITLYVAFELPDKVNHIPVPSVSIFLDTNHYGGSAPQTDDLWFKVDRNGSASLRQGTGSAWGAATSFTRTYGLTETMSGWSVEFGIPFSKLGISAGTFKELGLALGNWGAGPANLWPGAAISTQPGTWGSLVSSSDWDTFYWKPGPWEDYAPSGMPDFDQRQDMWWMPGPVGPISTHCGPVAMANSLWWFDSKFETLTGTMPPVVSDTYRLVTSYGGPGTWDDHDPQNVGGMGSPGLVDDLARYFNTNDMQGANAWLGTYVTDMHSGTLQYLRDRGLWDDYIVTLVISPTFDWVADEVMRSEDVILQLGFYEWVTDTLPGRWARVGGHYVNVAGVDPAGLIAFSDPFVDATGNGIGIIPPGRVLSGTLIPHQPIPGHTPDVHNDAGNVSHDVYPMVDTNSPGGVWGPDDYPWDLFWDWFFTPVNPHPWIDTEPWFEMMDPLVQVEVEFALAVSPYTWKSSGEWIVKDDDPMVGTWRQWMDYAPNGVPDFDQKQDCWGTMPCPPTPPAKYTFCGPAAAANSLWWFDSKFEPVPLSPPAINDNYPLVTSYSGILDDHDPLNVDDPLTPWMGPGTPGEFVEDLANYFQTDMMPGSSGTDITNLAIGIEQYITDHKLRQGYVITMVESPDFWWVAEEVEVSEDVILLLGFWEEIAPGEFNRLGGHYVTLPGVDKQGGFVAFSDPWFDRIGQTWPLAGQSQSPFGLRGWPEYTGRVADGWQPGYSHIPIPHTVYTLHNDAGNISHDVYHVVGTDSPGGVWGPELYVEFWWPDLENFGKQNGEWSPYNGGDVQTEVDGAIAVSPVADVWITKTVVPTTVSPGDWITFTLVFTNMGNDAEDVVISDALPSGLTNATYTYSLNYLGMLTHTNTYTWTVGKLRWMEGGTITVTAQVDAGVLWPPKSVITNTVEITTTTTEQYQMTPYPNRAQAPFTVTFTPTLAYDWRKLVNGVSWTSGFTVTAQTLNTITVTDIISASQPFTLTEIWDPAHLALTSYYTQGGGSVLTATGWLTWTGPVGQIVTLTKYFHVEPCTWTQTILEEALNVGGGLTEARPITIDKLPPRLQITSDYQTQVYAGQNAAFTLHYSNTGGYENDVWITNTFPISAPFVSSNPVATRQAGDGTWAAWDIGGVGPPGSISVTVAISDVLVPGTWITITDWIYNHVGEPVDGVTTTFHVTCAQVTGVSLVYTNTGTIYTDTVVHFSADIAPDYATKPYTYTIFKDGGLGSTATSSDDPLLFTDTFNITGTHAVTIHVWNCAMTTPVTDVITFTVYAPGTCVDLTGVDLTLLTSTPIYTNTNVQFSADMNPNDATKPYSYSIDYDDGISTTSTSSVDPLTSLDHTFAFTGAYDVEIAVWNCAMGESQAVTGTVVVTVSQQITPCADVNITNLDSDSPVDLGQAMHFTATVTGDTPITYTWDFDNDGNPEQSGVGLDIVSYTYGSAGAYTATLDVENGCPSTDTDYIVVTVNTYHTLTVAQDGTGSGTVTPAVGQHSYISGTTIWLTATADAGSTFACWSGDAGGSTSPVSVTMDSDKAVTATFVLTSCVNVDGADFTFAPTKPVVGDVVNFTGTVTAGDPPITYTWNFDDGSPVQEGNPINHTFPITATEQTYTVVMTASNACPSDDTVSKDVTILPRRIYLPLVLRSYP